MCVCVCVFLGGHVSTSAARGCRESACVCMCSYSKIHLIVFLMCVSSLARNTNKTRQCAWPSGQWRRQVSARTHTAKHTHTHAHTHTHTCNNSNNSNITLMYQVGDLPKCSLPGGDKVCVCGCLCAFVGLLAKSGRVCMCAWSSWGVLCI